MGCGSKARSIGRRQPAHGVAARHFLRGSTGAPRANGAADPGASLEGCGRPTPICFRSDASKSPPWRAGVVGVWKPGGPRQCLWRCPQGLTTAPRGPRQRLWRCPQGLTTENTWSAPVLVALSARVNHGATWSAPVLVALSARVNHGATWSAPVLVALSARVNHGEHEGPRWSTEALWRRHCPDRQHQRARRTAPLAARRFERSLPHTGGEPHPLGRGHHASVDHRGPSCSPWLTLADAATRPDAGWEHKPQRPIPPWAHASASECMLSGIQAERVGSTGCGSGFACRRSKIALATPSAFPPTPLGRPLPGAEAG